MPPKREFLNLDDLVKQYLSGVPLSHLAKQEGSCSLVLRKAFVNAGVKIRSRTERIFPNIDSLIA